MTNLIKKHKIFLVLLLALLMMLAGFVFCLQTRETKETKASTATINLSWSACWKNPKGTTGTTAYTNFTGDKFLKSVGTVTMSLTRRTGDGYRGSWSKSSGTVSTYGSSSDSATFTASMGVMEGMLFPEQWTAWAASTVTPIAGFTANKKSSSYVVKESGYVGGLNGNVDKDVTYDVVFSPLEYDIKYFANEGLFDDGTTEQSYEVYTYNRFFKPTDPTRTGYTFDGWNSKADGTGSAIGTYLEDVSITEYYAIWTANEYTATWNANGGKFSDNTTSKKTTCTYDSNYILPEDPTRDGYKFLGWKRIVTILGVTLLSVDITSASIYNLTANTTVTAQWQDIRFSILFDRQSGSGGNSSIDVEIGKAVGSSGVPSRTGYTFGGYYTATDGGGTQIFNTSGTFVTGNDYDDTSGNWSYYGDLTVYAKWTENSYNIAFDGNGGSGSMTTLLGKRYTESVTLPANAFTKTGYTFAGWGTSASSGAIYSNQASVSMLSSTDGATVTLYAQWTENTYNIAFNANGGSGTMDTLTGVLYTESKTLSSNIFTRANYIFKSWNTSADGTGTQYLNEATVAYLSSTDGATVTMYAQWEETWSNKGSAPSGSGTASSPYLIATAQNLAWLSNQTVTNTTAVGGYYKQTANINLSGTKWNPIGNTSCNFIGEYDGNGYVITNLDILSVKNASGEYMYYHQGLFGYVNNATIKNVNVLSGNIYGNDGIGGVVGAAWDSTIIGCQSSVTIDSKHCGGIVGVATNTTIENCYSKANITASNIAGGVIGWSNSATLKSCGFGGTLTNTLTNILVSGGTVTVSDCFGVVSTSNSFVSTSGATVTNSLYISNGTKKYYGSNSTFANWVISTTQTPLPKGLSWLGNGGTKVTSLSQITALGYTLVS